MTDIIDDAIKKLETHEPKKHEILNEYEDWEIILRNALDDYNLAYRAIKSSNFVVYYGDHIDEMIELVCNIWGEGSLSVLHYIEPGSVESIIQHLQRASANTICFISDKKYLKDSNKDMFLNQVEKYSQYLPGNKEQFQVRNTNYLKNWKYLENSIIFDGKGFEVPSAIIWGASPGLDDVIKTCNEQNLWEHINKSFNCVSDSALPALVSTPLRIDVVSSLDGMNIKEKSIIDNMPPDCLFHLTAGTNHKILDAIDNPYFMEIDHEANYLLVAGSHEYYRNDVGTDNVAMFAHHFLTRWIHPEIILLVGCECCYREEQTHSKDVVFENQADKAGLERVEVRCLDGEDRQTHSFLKLAATTWSHIINAKQTFNATMESAAFAYCIKIYKWASFAMQNPCEMIDWKAQPKSLYNTYDEQANDFIECLKQRKKSVKAVLSLQAINPESDKSKAKTTMINFNTAVDTAVTSTVTTYNFYRNMITAEMLKTVTRKANEQKRKKNIQNYYAGYTKKYLEAIEKILEIMEGNDIENAE